MCCAGCLMAVVSGPLHPSWCLCRLTGLSSTTIATSAAMCSPSGTSCLACESATHGPAAERQQLCHMSWRSAGGTCCAPTAGLRQCLCAVSLQAGRLLGEMQRCKGNTVLPVARLPYLCAPIVHHTLLPGRQRAACCWQWMPAGVWC
jgi:hypothetical protein